MGLALCTLACLTCLAVAPIDRVDGVPDREPEWIHVSHDQFPLSFDITREHSLQRVGVFSMARARSDSDRVIEVDLFGLHPLPHRLAAVLVAFFWVMDRYKGADEQSLAGLHARIQDSETVESFLRAVFYSRMEVELRDRGARFVDGHRGRRISVSRTVARGTSDERVIRGEAVLVAVSPREALVIVGRFDEQATPAERERFFPHVLDSVRIGVTGEGALHARR